MAITPQVYTASATWTAVQLADIWKQMFIDAGLMADWYDSVSSSTEWQHRILRLTNDSGKTYGYQYIWLTFYTYNGTGYIFLQFATGWNASTHAPVGTQYLDYVNTSCTTSLPNPYTTLWSGSQYQTFSFVRYTSAIDSNYTYIGGPVSVLIRKSIGTVPGWLDLSKQAAFSFFQLQGSSSATGSGYRVLYFNLPYNIRRILYAGRSFSGNYATGPVTAAYSYGGVNSGSDVNDAGANGNWYGAVRLPSFHTSVNPAYASNYAPVVTGIDVCPGLDMRLPDDFAMTTTIGLVPTQRSFIYVTPGVESWEVAMVTSAASTNGMCFLARAV